jgi:hypothetical protein
VEFAEKAVAKTNRKNAGYLEKAELVKLRYFVGMTIEEAAEALAFPFPRPTVIWLTHAPG